MHASANAGSKAALSLAEHPAAQLGGVLANVFATLERAGIRYCVLHGYETYPDRVDSDVDCVIDAKITPCELYRLLQQNRAEIGADVVRCHGYHLVLATSGSELR